MHEKLFRTQGSKPSEELHRILAETRARNDRFTVTLGSPPFERDEQNRIVAIRLRFEPRPHGARGFDRRSLVMV